ncbi:uncharacterized protein TrAtP1_007341 [Trichoderma atroviride]|uniref:uncharacterized protein n=1 Tax=Hypocrea atroviridis TaxID=63577 RepID=UPI00333108D7|nr:hypothetical protein TrAtP1_007341 [Trichoderma atroviride]
MHSITLIVDKDSNAVTKPLHRQYPQIPIPDPSRRSAGSPDGRTSFIHRYPGLISYPPLKRSAIYSQLALPRRPARSHLLSRPPKSGPSPPSGHSQPVHSQRSARRSMSFDERRRSVHRLRCSTNFAVSHENPRYR